MSDTDPVTDGIRPFPSVNSIDRTSGRFFGTQGSAEAFPDPSAALLHRRQLMLASVHGTDERRGLGQEIFDELAVDIIEGRLRPGETLDSVQLAERFGTSRTPVREALAALERQGVVLVPPRRRPSIAPITPKRNKDLHDVRFGLFGLVSRLIIERREQVDLSGMRAWLTALEQDTEAGAVDAYFWHNVGFRLIEVGLADNDDLRRLICSLGLVTLQLRHLSLSVPGRLPDSLRHHRALVECYERGDADGAVAANQALIGSGYHTLENAGLAAPFTVE